MSSAVASGVMMAEQVEPTEFSLSDPWSEGVRPGPNDLDLSITQRYVKLESDAK